MRVLCPRKATGNHLPGSFSRATVSLPSSPRPMGHDPPAHSASMPMTNQGNNPLGGVHENEERLAERNARLLGWVSLPIEQDHEAETTETTMMTEMIMVTEMTGMDGTPSKSRHGDGRPEGAFSKKDPVVVADPGSIWFHAPSASLARALPKHWVAFSSVSGGILADVSRS